MGLRTNPPEWESSVTVHFILGCSEHHDRRVLQRVRSEYGVAGYLRDVQIEYHKVWVEAGFSQHLNRLLAVTSDVEMHRRPALCKRLTDEKRVTAVIFDE